MGGWMEGWMGGEWVMEGGREREGGPVRPGAQWQLNCRGDKTVVNVRALLRNSCLYWQLLSFQYRMDFTVTAYVYALLLRIRKRSTQIATLGTSGSQ